MFYDLEKYKKILKTLSDAQLYGYEDELKEIALNDCGCQKRLKLIKDEWEERLKSTPCLKKDPKEDQWTQEPY